MNILPTSATEFPLSGNVRIRQVAQFLAMSESTVHRRVKEAGFPQPVQLSSRLVVFDAAEIRQWQQRRAAIR